MLKLNPVWADEAPEEPEDAATAAANMDDRFWSIIDGVCGVRVGGGDCIPEHDPKGVGVTEPEPDLSVSDPTPRGGLLLKYSSSSTVHTAPLTFSTRIKHL